jgi:hypothetical protein
MHSSRREELDLHTCTALAQFRYNLHLTVLVDPTVNLQWLASVSSDMPKEWDFLNYQRGEVHCERIVEWSRPRLTFWLS